MMMKEYTVDLSGAADREALHARLKEYLPLPPWYGGNLDALYDVLTDLEEPLYIRFIGWEDLKSHIPDYFDSFTRAVRDAQEEAEGLFCFFEEENRAGAPGQTADTSDDLVEYIFSDEAVESSLSDGMPEPVCDGDTDKPSEENPEWKKKKEH